MFCISEIKIYSPPRSCHIDRTNLVVAGWKNLVLGEYVTIGPRALIYCISSKVIFKKKIVVGPGLTIIAGDHNFTEVGKFICDQHLKVQKMIKMLLLKAMFGLVAM